MNQRSDGQRQAATDGLPGLMAAAALGAMLSLACAAAVAAPPAPSPFAAFEQWVGSVHAAQPAGQPDAQPKATPGAGQAVALAGKTAAAAVRFEPLPVIVGAPELPLVGGSTQQRSAAWGSELNYQGLHARYVLLDAQGRETGMWPLSRPMPAGQRFRIRITSSFDGVAGVDQVLGKVWDSRRAAQLYPEPGQSVALKAGQPSTLPVGPNQHFVMRGRAATERLVLHVRHAKATKDSRSDQPAYRQETAGGSSYLQLVRTGQFPHIEQVLTMRR